MSLAAARRNAASRDAGLSKRFPGIVALDEVDFEADAGEVRVAVAPTAPATTFMNILAGVFPPARERYASPASQWRSRRRAPRTSLASTSCSRNSSSTPELTVAENIFLGREPVSRYRLIDRKRLRRDAAEILDRYHLTTCRPTPWVGSLSVAQRQQVELARALSTSARILILMSRPRCCRRAIGKSCGASSVT